MRGLDGFSHSSLRVSFSYPAYNTHGSTAETVGRKPYTEPVWFIRKKDPLTGNPIWASNGKYWDAKAKQDWSACPDIF